MYQTLFRHPIAWAIAAFAALLLISSTIFVVPETQQAIVVRLGKPNRIINAYDQRQPFGMTGAGLVARIPFIETVLLVDKRVLDRDMAPQPEIGSAHVYSSP